MIHDSQVYCSNIKGFLTVSEKWGNKKTLQCYPKNHFIEANIVQFVLGLSQIPDIMGGKKKQGDWHHDDFSWGKKVVYT